MFRRSAPTLLIPTLLALSLAACGTSPATPATGMDAASAPAPLTAQATTIYQPTGTSTYGGFTKVLDGRVTYDWQFTNHNPDFGGDPGSIPGPGFATMNVSYRVNDGAWTKTSIDVGPYQTGTFRLPGPVPGKRANSKVQVSWAGLDGAAFLTRLRLTCGNGKDPAQGCS